MTISEIADKALMPREPGFDTVALPVNVVNDLIADWRAMRDALKGHWDNDSCAQPLNRCPLAVAYQALKVKP